MDSVNSTVSEPIDEDGAEHSEPVRKQLKELRLHHSIGFAMTGQIGYVLSQMAILASLAHLRGPEAVGEFGLALSVTTPPFMFVRMGSKTSQSSDVTHRYSYAEYAGLVVTTALLAMIVAISAGFLLADTKATLLIVVIVAMTKVVESISNLSYGAFQQAGRVDKVAISQLLRGAFTVPLFAGMLWMGVPVGLAFTAQLVVWSALAFGRDYRLGSRIAVGHFVWPSFNRSRLWILAKEVSPLGASYVINSLLVSLPRLFVESALGLRAVGILTVVNNFQQGGMLVVSAISQAIVNRFARLRHKNATKALRRTIMVLLAFATVCSVGGLLLTDFAGEWILGFVFGPQFVSAQGLLMIIALTICTRLYGVIPQSMLHAERRFKTFLFREIAAVVVCVGLLLYCIPRWGLMGAGYAILAASVFRLVVMIFAIKLAPPRPLSEETLAQGLEQPA